jgi:NAD(P)-dependent dehydrogenase (short-subunit alcohol dehydrogenase family)
MGLMNDKVVIVTGAGRGIGRSHALRFAAEGAKVVVNDVGIEVTRGPDGSGITEPTDTYDPSVAVQVVEEIKRSGGEAIADQTDLSTFAGGKQLIANALAAFGKVDALVNNAGTMTIMKVGEIEEGKLLKELAVHVTGYIGTIQAVWPHMIEQGGGSIVNTSSGFGGSGPGLTTYMAAKSAVFSVTRDVALEGARHNISCNSLTPAARTRMSVPYWGADQTAGWDPNFASTLALYYCSSLSAGVTGKQLLLSPGNAVREMYIESHGLANDEEWTPETLAERLPGFLYQPPKVEGLRLPPLRV